MDLSQLDPNIDWYSKYYASKGEWKKCTDYKERGYDLLKVCLVAYCVKVFKC